MIVSTNKNIYLISLTQMMHSLLSVHNLCTALHETSWRAFKSTTHLYSPGIFQDVGKILIVGYANAQALVVVLKLAVGHFPGVQAGVLQWPHKPRPQLRLRGLP